MLRVLMVDNNIKVVKDVEDVKMLRFLGSLHGVEGESQVSQNTKKYLCLVILDVYGIFTLANLLYICHIHQQQWTVKKFNI